jgi:hypothetical protein
MAGLHPDTEPVWIQSDLVIAPLVNRIVLGQNRLNIEPKVSSWAARTKDKITRHRVLSESDSLTKVQRSINPNLAPVFTVAMRGQRRESLQLHNENMR